MLREVSGCDCEAGVIRGVPVRGILEHEAVI